MRKSELDADPPPAAAQPPIPVICERCRAEGLAGDDPFAHLADLLDFTPVVRRGRADGWTPEKQRAFIAALVVTGSPRRAAQAIGKHENGATQLKKARGSASFTAAWDAALELARERELAALKDGLIELAEEHDEDYHRRRCALLPKAERAALPSPSPWRGEGRGEGAWSEHQALSAAGNPIPPDCDYDPDLHTDDYPEYWEAKRQVRERMLKARRLLLYLYANDPDPACRLAWETLCGPVNWAQAQKLEAEDGEAYGCPGQGRGAMTSVHDADVMIVAEAGFLPDLSGGRDGIAEVFEEAFRMQAAGELEVG